tara:strand:+ start:504 stop:1229 length:726 start_codon:yes stop_codon:yes gene_type:complete
MVQKSNSFILLLLLLVVSVTVNSQQNVTTFGIQFKPIFSSELVNTGPQTNVEGDISFTLEQQFGYSFGMVIRKGLTKQLSLETGINFTQRNYQLSIFEDSTNFNGVSNFRYVIYEIPIKGMVYVQMGQQTYLNAAFGITLNFLPSNWSTFDTYFEHFSVKRSWIVPALLTNLGFEYRTQDKGYYYAGFSLQQPFTNITTAGVLFKIDQLEQERTFFDVAGNYLTFDLRYFFNEPPERRRRR